MLEQRHLADQGRSRRAVDGHAIACLEDAAVLRGQAPVPAADHDSRGPHDAGKAETPRDHRGVACHAAPLGEDAGCRMHAANVLGRGFAPHENHGLAPGMRRSARLRVHVQVFVNEFVGELTDIVQDEVGGSGRSKAACFPANSISVSFAYWIIQLFD